MGGRYRVEFISRRSGVSSATRAGYNVDGNSEAEARRNFEMQHPSTGSVTYEIISITRIS